MPKLTNGRVPKLRCHKASGRAIVTLNGTDISLGRWGTKEAEVRYNEEIARWLANGRKTVQKKRETTTIEGVCSAWTEHVNTYYVKNGKKTSESRSYKTICKELERLYGRMEAAEFSTKEFLTVRNHFILNGACRKTTNSYASKLIRMFRWAATSGMIPASVCHALREVPSLKRNRSVARETESVGPAPEKSVVEILKVAKPKLRAMIEIQRLTGMRPGELVSMTLAEIDRTKSVWVYTPGDHKSKHLGKTRTITIGPKAQTILAPWVAKAEAADGILWKSRNGRQVTRKNYYSTVCRLCDKAGVPQFHVHQLRHSMATTTLENLMSEGLKQIQEQLGHSDVETTKIYAAITAKIQADLAAAFG